MFLSSCRVVVLVVLALVSACMLAACDDAPPEQTQASPGTAKPAGAPKVAQISNDMVAAVSAGKTASAVGVHFALGALPSVGKALPMEIAIVPHRKFSAVRAHFEGPDGLKVTVGEDFGPSSDAVSETSLKHQLVLLPGNEGVFMLTVVVDTDSDEGNVTRIFSIPVIVGPTQQPAAASAPAEKPDPAPAIPATN